MGTASPSAGGFPLGSSVAGLGQKAWILRALEEKNVYGMERLLA